MRTNLNIIKNSILKISLAIVIVFFLSGCEKEEISSPENISFELPEISYVGESINLLASTIGYDEVEWTISDGSIYNQPEIDHSFSKSGNYTIKLTVYSNHKQVASVSKSIYILYNHKLIQSENQFLAVRGKSLLCSQTK